MERSSESSHIRRSGDMTVDAPPELAFRLFTGPGEELWIDDWRPVVQSGDGLAAGTVFTTAVHEETVWVVVDFDPSNLHARYARFTPGSRVGTVDVKVRPDNSGGSTAAVTYELTSLSDGGAQVLEEFSEAAFDTMLRDWEQAIRDARIDYGADLFVGDCTY